MDGKTKIVAAVAAGAVALTIGAGAARCSMDAPDAQNGQQAPQEQASGKQDDAKASQSSQQAPDERQPSESEFSSLANTSWTSRDGASKLSITKDALIELDWQPLLGQISQRVRPANLNSTGLM